MMLHHDKVRADTAVKVRADTAVKVSARHPLRTDHSALGSFTSTLNPFCNPFGTPFCNPFCTPFCNPFGTPPQDECVFNDGHPVCREHVAAGRGPAPFHHPERGSILYLTDR